MDDCLTNGVRQLQNPALYSENVLQLNITLRIKLIRIIVTILSYFINNFFFHARTYTQPVGLLLQ